MKIELISSMGDDNHIAHCARHSFDKKAEDYDDEANNRLNKYLARENHIIPFAHVQVCCSIEAPVFLMRQLMRSNIGVVYSEVSRRYVDYEPTYWLPGSWRSRPDKSIKQGSGEVHPTPTRINALVRTAYKETAEIYDTLIEAGLAPEQARAVLPQGMYTKVIATGSLLYWSRVYNLRAGHIGLPQADWKPVMEQLNDIMIGVAPVAWKELTGGQ